VTENSIQEGLRLPVMEHFYTIQGEGINTGRAAYFVRLGGCDVGCTWCDVKESWDASLHPLMSVGEIVSAASSQPARLVVITGGEPLMYNLDELTKQFKGAGFETAIETSGAYPLSGAWDWVCLSPKKFKGPLREVLLLANELKVIAFHTSDLEWADAFRTNVQPNCYLLLQPEYSRFDRIMPEIISFVKDHPQWRISLQTHKIIRVP
jgi:organic radical activating enzyme